MDDPDQSSLVSSSASPAAGQERRQPPPRQGYPFQYQFEREPEQEEDEDEEEEEEDDERLEVRERKPAAPAPPLLDLGASGEQPPARPPPAPQPVWTSHPIVSSSSSSSFAAAAEFASPEEKDKEPPRSAPPPPPPPHREDPPAPAVPPRSAPPPPPKREEPPAAVAPKRGAAASGSPDETLFALPVTSEPLMPSSADKGMDSQEQPGHVPSAGPEDFAAVPLDATASLPSLSPLSANPFKEYAALETVSHGPSAKRSYDQVEIEAFETAAKNVRNPFLAADDGDAPESKHSGVFPPFSGAALFSLSQTEEPVDTKVRSDTGKFPAHQQDSSPDSPVELFAKQDKQVYFENRKYDADDHAEKVDFIDDYSARDEYVDFKPFEPTWASNEMNAWKDSARNQGDGKLESGIDKYDVEKAKTLSSQKDSEKESESSNEDISFPSTPEATKESLEAYITCAKIESAATVEGSAPKPLPLVEEQASENKTDEKKIAEMKAHLGTEPSGVHTELVGGQGQKADSEKAESLPKPPVDAAANTSEGLTPDLVQEAYESELHDAISPKLAYETKIDLVQTSELLQEPLNAAAQLCPSFEGGSETTPSPVLPDIVMEAPLNASTVGSGGPIVQLEASPLETAASAAAATAAEDYENILQRSEKPPSYQEAMNVPATQAQETKVDAAAKEPEYKNAPENLETSYISIACDLVKETSVPGSASPAFTDYTKMAECVSQPVPEHTKHFEAALLPSGESGLFGTRKELAIDQKEREAVTDKPLETATKIVPEGGQEEKREVSLPSKPYLESFQPQLEPSKNVSTAWFLEGETADLAKKEKTPQLHMEEFKTYSDAFPVSKEPQMSDNSVPSEESSPETEDFPTSPYEASKLVTEAIEKSALQENESRETLSAVKTEVRQLPYQEVAQDLSLKNVHVKVEEQELALEKPSDKVDREVPEAPKKPSLPADVPPLPAEREVVSVGKEAERGVASVKEKEKFPPMLPSKLSKPSVVDLLYWRDVKKTGVVFGASLFLLLSLTVFSIVSVVAYIALALLSVAISFRIYKGVIQAIQKSDEGHPFRAYLDKDVAVSEELVQKYSHVVLGHCNNTVKELRRLFLVDDLVDSLKFAVLMWVFTYVGALFNGLTLLILALVSLFSIPVIYEKHQAQIDHYLGLVNKNVKDTVAKIQAKIPGLKRKAE